MEEKKILRQKAKVSSESIKKSEVRVLRRKRKESKGKTTEWNENNF